MVLGPGAVGVPARAVFLLIIIVAAIGRVPTHSAPHPYGAYEIGPPGGVNSEGLAVNELGYAVVGRAQTASGAYHAFVKGWSADRDLGTLGGAESTAVAAHGGQIVGRAQTANGEEHAFLADASASAALIDLGTLGGTHSTGRDVRSGLVVGGSLTAGNTQLQAFQYESGRITALPIDLGGSSEAMGVNAAGDIVGYACTAGQAACRAFLLRGSELIDVGSLGGRSVANKINDAGDIVGTSWLADQQTARAFIYRDGVMTDLGTLGGASSQGLGINSRSEVVGTALDAAGAPRAFVWRDGVMTDLNTLVPAGTGWLLTSASGISDGGQIVATGARDGLTRAFLLTPPTDLGVSAGGVRSQADSNRPRGVEVGKTVRFVVSVQALSEEPINIYDARLTDTLSGPAEFVSAHPNGDGSCDVTPSVVTCDVRPVDSPGLGREVTLVARVLDIGAFSHTAVVTSGTPDANVVNDAVTEQNRGVALNALTLTPASTAGGRISTARLILSDIAPAGDAVVRLASSRPDIAPVPQTFVVPNWTDKREFHITPAAVSQPTEVEITATYGLVSRTAPLMVLPAALGHLYLTPTTIAGGCQTSVGKIVLNGVAPPAGAVVTLVNTNDQALVPPSLTIEPGTVQRTFTVPTNTVTAPATGAVTATYGGVSQTLPVTVRPIRVEALTLSSNVIAGGSTATAHVQLECGAAPGPIAVALTSGNPDAAMPVVSTITIPAGGTTGAFTIRSTPVMAAETVNIYAGVFGVRKSATLVVTPSGAASAR